jgi:hypothetical protein
VDKKQKFKKFGKWAAAWAITQPLAYGSMWAIRAVVLYFTRDPKILAMTFVGTTWLPWSNEIGLLLYAAYRKWRLKHDKTINGAHVAHTSQ